ncbi:MAG: zinc-ribbon domain containing protein, partial [Acidobacteriaceae bacterium]
MGSPPDLSAVREGRYTRFSECARFARSEGQLGLSARTFTVRAGAKGRSGSVSLNRPRADFLGRRPGCCFAAFQLRLGSCREDPNRSLGTRCSGFSAIAQLGPYPKQRYHGLQFGRVAASRRVPHGISRGEPNALHERALYGGCFGRRRGKRMEFVDKILKCADCGTDFVFTAGE